MKLFSTLILTCLFFQLSAQFKTSSTSSEAMGLFAQGKEADATGSSETASNFFEQAIEIDSNFVDAYVELAGIYRKEGKLDKTIECYQKSLEVYPRNLRVHQDLAAVYQMNNDFDAAINQYQELLKHFPAYPEAYLGMALVHFNQKDYPQTIKYAENAMRLYLSSKSNLNAAEARMLAGKAYLKYGEYPKAIKYFKASKKHFEDKAYFHYYLGVGYLKKKDKEKANEYLDNAKRMGYKIPPYILEELNRP